MALLSDEARDTVARAATFSGPATVTLAAIRSAVNAIDAKADELSASMFAAIPEPVASSVSSSDQRLIIESVVTARRIAGV